MAGIGGSLMGQGPGRGQHWLMAVCLAASLGGHVAALHLSVPVLAHVPPGLPTMKVRLASNPASQSQTPVDSTRQSDRGQSPVPVAAMFRAAEAWQDLPSRTEPEVVEAQEGSGSPVLAQSPSDVNEAWMDSFVPRPLLSVAPQAFEPVLLEWPESSAELNGGDEGGVTSFKGVLALFIDDQGWVQGIRMQEGNLTPAQVQAAEIAFRRARFSAGEVDGQAVKSRVFVEVSFDRPEMPVLARGRRP